MDLGIDFDEQLEKLAKVPKAARLGVVAALLIASGDRSLLVELK